MILTRNWLWAVLCIGVIVASMGGLPAHASDLVAVQQLTDRVLMLHFKDGYVQHHRRGEPRSAEQVLAVPLDVTAASRPSSYTLTSADDPAYRQARQPVEVG